MDANDFKDLIGNVYELVRGPKEASYLLAGGSWTTTLDVDSLDRFKFMRPPAGRAKNNVGIRLLYTPAE